MNVRRLWSSFAIGLLLAIAAAGEPARAEGDIVSFTADFPVGSIVIVNRERQLYLIEAAGMARRYPVAVGVHDEVWTGREVVTDKKENPRWVEPDDDGEGDVIEGGAPNNPLGKRALYLGRTLWRIHGTIRPQSIGKMASNGCIRMYNDHVIDLYDRVTVGTEVYVVDKLGDRRPARGGRKLVDD